MCHITDSINLFNAPQCLGCHWFMAMIDPIWHDWMGAEAVTAYAGSWACTNRKCPLCPLNKLKTDEPAP